MTILNILCRKNAVRVQGSCSRALEDSDIAGLIAAEVLPALGILFLKDHPASTVHRFIAARSESGHPVTTVDLKKKRI